MQLVEEYHSWGPCIIVHIEPAYCATIRDINSKRKAISYAANFLLDILFAQIRQGTYSNVYRARDSVMASWAFTWCNPMELVWICGVLVAFSLNCLLENLSRKNRGMWFPYVIIPFPFSPHIIKKSYNPSLRLITLKPYAYESQLVYFIF